MVYNEKSSRVEVIALLAWCVVLFAVAVTAFTSYNDFPLHFHPDEPGKVQQLIDRDYNFRHPQLLLITSEITSRVLGMRERDELGAVGRGISAVAAGVAIVALTLVGWRLRRWPGAIMAGVVLLLNPSLGFYAHFMKEDCLFLMGLSLWLLSLVAYLHKPTRRGLLLMGIACALAASAKYLGAMCIGISLLVVLIRPWTGAGRLKVGGLFLLAAMITSLIININFLLHPKDAVDGLKYELEHVAEGHLGFTINVPHLLYLQEFKAMHPVVPALAAIYFVGLIINIRRRSAGEWAVALFPLVFFALLSSSPLVSPRYFLPVYTGFMLLAALGAVDLASWIERLTRTQRFHVARWGAVAMAVVLAILLAPSFYKLSVLAFKNDPRYELRDYILAHLPADAVIASQPGVGLIDSKGNRDPKFNPDMPQHVFTIPNFGSTLSTKKESIDSMTRMLEEGGFTHVVLMTGRYRIFEDPYDTLAPKLRPEFLQYQAFYRDLLANSELIWSKEYPHGVHRISRTRYQAQYERRTSEKLELYKYNIPSAQTPQP